MKLGHLGDDSRKWDFALHGMLLGSWDNSVIGYLNNSHLECKHPVICERKKSSSHCCFNYYGEMFGHFSGLDNVHVFICIQKWLQCHCLDQLQLWMMLMFCEIFTFSRRTKGQRWCQGCSWNQKLLFSFSVKLRALWWEVRGYDICKMLCTSVETKSSMNDWSDNINRSK